MARVASDNGHYGNQAELGRTGFALMPIHGRLLYGLGLLRVVAGPCVWYRETDHLALEAARGTRHQSAAPGGPVTKDHITGAATDTLSLVSDMGCHRGPPFSTCDEGTS